MLFEVAGTKDGRRVSANLEAPDKFAALRLGRATGIAVGSAHLQTPPVASQPSPVPSPPLHVVSEFTVLFNGEQFGPHTHDEIAAMLSSGMIDASALVWRTDWTH